MSNGQGNPFDQINVGALGKAVGEEEARRTVQEIIESNTPVENLTRDEIDRAVSFLADRGPFSTDDFQGRTEREMKIIRRQLEMMGPQSRDAPPLEGRERVQQKREESNPFLSIEPPTGAELGPATSFTAGGAFSQGVKEEVLSPLRLFGVETEDVDTGRPIAEGLGKLTGLGIGFVPFIGAARWGLKGAGLVSMSAKGRRVIGGSEVAAQAAEGALSFGAFEAGRAEDVEGAIDHFVKGATAGAIFDPIAMKMMEPLLGRAAVAGREAAEQNVKFQDVIDIAETRVNPEQLSLERALKPENLLDTDAAGHALRQMVEPENQLDEVLAQVSTTYRPGGRAIVPAIQGPEKLLPQLKQALPDRVQLTTRRLEGDGFEMLVNDPGRELERLAYKLISKEEKTVAEKKLVRRFMGEGEIELDYDEMVGLVRENSKLVSAPREKINQEIKENLSTDFGFFGSTTFGRHRLTPSGETEIAVVESFKKMETLVHEYSHRFQTIVAADQGKVRPDLMSIQDLFRAAGRQDFTIGDIERVVKEMEGATEEILTRFHMRRSNVSRKTAAKRAVEDIAERSGYYKSNKELTSRLTELMLLNPKRAREVAPRATEVMGDAIQNVSPRLEKMLTREHLTVQNVVKQAAKERRVFTREPVGRLTKAQRRQWKKDGTFKGLEVFHQGRSWRIAGEGAERTQLVSRRGRKTSEKMYKIEHPFSGDSKVVSRSEFSRPVMPRLMERQARVVQKVDGLLDEGPTTWVTAALREPEGGNLVHGYVNLDDFLRTGNLRNWARRNRPEVRTGVSGRRPRGRVDDEEIARVLRAQGHKGALIEDNGAYELFLADEGAMTLGDVAITETVENVADGVIGQRRIQLSFENVMRGLLRDAGASERELPFLMQVAKGRHAQRLTDLMDDEVKQAMEGAQKAALSKSESLEDLAERTGLKVQRGEGLVTLMDSKSKTPVVKNVSEHEALEYILKAGVDSDEAVMARGETDMAVAAATGGDQTPVNGRQVSDEGFGVQMIGGGRKLKTQETLGYKAEDLADRDWWSNFLEGSQVLGATITGMETFAKLVEERGLGPAFSGVFTKTQQALRAMNREMQVGREALGGKSWAKALEELSEPLRKMPDERTRLLTDYLEFATKDEVAAAGGFIPRGMNDLELQVARRFKDLGVEEQLPRLQALRRLIHLRQQSKDQFLGRFDDVLARAQEAGNEGFVAQLQQLRQAAEEMPDNIDDVLARLDVTPQEREAIKIIDRHAGADPDDFSIMVTSKYAMAPEKPSRFGSGRDFFADMHNMTKGERQLAHRLEEIYSDAFQASGLDPKREIGMFWPHMRKYVEHGFNPESEFVQKVIPESTEWSSSLFRTGELDIYEKDPILTTHRYLRGLLRNKHLDPVLPEVKQALKQVEGQNPRAGRIMKEYMNEVLGRPHSSFEKIQEAIESGAQSMGLDISKNFTKDVVNTFAALSYGATIPFRIGLIMRNYFQMVQTIAPRTGMRDFFGGLERAIDDEGYQMAKKAGAIPENVAPVHATTEVFEEGILGNVNLTQRLDKLVKKGFDYYRSADELGRAAAYHAQRRRLGRAVDDFEADRIGWEEMLRKGKVKTFRQIDEDRFTEIYQSGDIEGAKDYLGATLARETIFRYGNANHPAGWNSVQGRLFGQFGSWPTQFKDYMMQGLTRGTTKDKAEFVGWTIATNGGVLAGAEATGLDLDTWVTLPSLQYTGGPYADIALSLTQVVGGSETERAMAMQNLKFQLPTLENPQSIALPLSYAAGDFWEFAQDPGGGTLMEGIGLKLQKPGEKTMLDHVLEPF